mgnify:CR=1 FL=1
MRALFLKYLVVIGVSMLGSILAMILILNALRASPAATKLEIQKREIVLDLTRAILTDEGPEAAARFAATSEAQLPLGLAITPDPGACARPDTEESRSVLWDGRCHLVTVEPPDKLLPYRLAPVMLGLAVLTASMIAAGLLARNLVSPVVLLRDGLSALAQGQFDVRIAGVLAARRDEIAQLSCDFDRTAERLQEHRDAQQRLFHDVSHELRSPLSRLQAVTGILRKSPAKLDAMLDRMDREIERLDGLVGEILTLARLSNRSGAALQTQRLDVIEILNDILLDATFEAQSRNVAVTTDHPGSFLADVDGELIYRALENVIRNATKFTAQGTAVEVRCAVTDAHLEVEIEDSGPGVDRKELDRIFQPFSRGGDLARPGGFGLGLAIARHAIERHGGRIRAMASRRGGLIVAMEIPMQPREPERLQPLR